MVRGVLYYVVRNNFVNFTDFVLMPSEVGNEKAELTGVDYLLRADVFIILADAKGGDYIVIVILVKQDLISLLCDEVGVHQVKICNVFYTRVGIISGN